MSFHWLLPGLLAGASQPGLLRPMEEDLVFLRGQGVRHIVSMTEAPLELPEGDWGFGQLHFPVMDMGIPQPHQAAAAWAWISARMALDEPVVIHCRAGLGRTGLLLACCLVGLGEPPERAIHQVRGLHPGFIQTKAQEDFITSFRNFIHGSQDFTTGPRP